MCCWLPCTVTPGYKQSQDRGVERGLMWGLQQPSAALAASDPRAKVLPGCTALSRAGPPAMRRFFLHPSASCARTGSASFPEPSRSPYFTVYSHLCLQGNWDKVEVLAGPKLYSLLSGDEKHLSLFLLITGAEVLYCLRRIAAAGYELWMK